VNPFQSVSPEENKIEEKDDDDLSNHGSQIEKNESIPSNSKRGRKSQFTDDTLTLLFDKAKSFLKLNDFKVELLYSNSEFAQIKSNKEFKTKIAKFTYNSKRT
jgi:hypothetical protein